ncbi:MAG: hypothetical protein ACE5RC_03945 [Nitrosopumilus sp.]
MVLTFIAFTECSLHPKGHWEQTQNRPDFSANEGIRFMPIGKDSNMQLIDLVSRPRKFKFTNHACVIRLINNVVIFDSEDTEEIFD